MTVNDVFTEVVMTVNDAVTDAFENFFHDFVMNNLDKNVQDKDVWGPKYWRQFGLDVKNNKIVFDSEEQRLLFLLSWS
jgi:hypothetical protein